MTNEIFRCVAGSRLFGTTTPNSDTDYKAVHIPDGRSILLGTANAVIDRSTGNSKTPNSADDVDMLSFPVQDYLSKLAGMETNAIEMLFAPNQHKNPLWEHIGDNRFRIMSSKKKAFTGYAKGQAMRYAVRGDRLTSLIELVTRLEKLDPKVRMNFQQPLDVFDGIPGVTVYRKTEGNAQASVQTPYLNALGREVPLTCFPKEAIKVFSKPIDEAGKRTQMASGDGGPDWKGLYHAQRIVDEGMELFSTGELIFPCRRAAYYREIRAGDHSVEQALDQFEESLLELEELTPISDFREKPDYEWIDNMVVQAHMDAVAGSWT